jgi:3-hydroxyacyl-CoA dehydrogenase
MDDSQRQGAPGDPRSDPFSTTGPIAVIGAGLTGASWAALFAAHGRPVRLHDQDPQRLAAGVERAREQALFLVQHGLARQEEAAEGVRALVPCGDLAEAVGEAAFIQEAVFDSYEAKAAVFAAVDRVAPRYALIATSTSGLSISRIQAGVRFPDRCLAGHPYNPPHLIPLVEIAPGRQTAPQAVAAAKRFYESVGKAPVVLRREVPGYLANRLAAALWREAINLVLDGVASVADVDEAIRLGPGLRWAVMGPHLLYHLGGGAGGIRYHIQHLGATKAEMWQDMDDWKVLPDEAADVLEQGLPPLDEISTLARQRDEALVRVIQALGIGPGSSQGQ